MRIAILISGEYRTFKHCRRTMNFLDDPRADIYVSTWDSSSYVSPKINLNVNEVVIKQHIQADLGKKATILIEPQSLVEEVKYSTKMMHRWKAGIKLIQDSNKRYDYVIVMRPDLFFHGPINLNNLLKYNLSLGVAWATEEYVANKKLQDVLFVSSYDNICKLVGALDIDEWINGPEGDWHTWWHNHCEKNCIINYAREFSHCTFYRYLTDSNSPSFNDVLTAQHDWRDLQILNQIDIMGRDAVLTAWPEHVINIAESKWNDGYFNKFIK